MIRLQDLKVMIVDDEPEIAELIASEFARNGSKTFEATSGNQAIDMLQQVIPDVIITDIRMAQGSGIDLIRKTREPTLLRSRCDSFRLCNGI